jgi:hypothetical protein
MASSGGKPHAWIMQLHLLPAAQCFWTPARQRFGLRQSTYQQLL